MPIKVLPWERYLTSSDGSPCILGHGLAVGLHGLDVGRRAEVLQPWLVQLWAIHKYLSRGTKNNSKAPPAAAAATPADVGCWAN